MSLKEGLYFNFYISIFMRTGTFTLTLSKIVSFQYITGIFHL